MGDHVRPQGHGAGRNRGFGPRRRLPGLLPQRSDRTHDAPAGRRLRAQHRAETAQPGVARLRGDPRGAPERPDLLPARFRIGALERGSADKLFPDQRAEHHQPLGLLRRPYEHAARRRGGPRGDGAPASGFSARNLRDAQLRRLPLRLRRAGENIRPDAVVRGDPAAVRLPGQPRPALPVHHPGDARGEHPGRRGLLQPAPAGHSHLHAGGHHGLARHHHRHVDHHGRPLQLLPRPPGFRLDPRGAAHHDRGAGHRLAASRETAGQPDRLFAGNRHQPRRLAARGAAVRPGAARQISAGAQHDGLLRPAQTVRRTVFTALRTLHRLGTPPPLDFHRGPGLGLRHPDVPAARQDRTERRETAPAALRMVQRHHAEPVHIRTPRDHRQGFRVVAPPVQHRDGALQQLPRTRAEGALRQRRHGRRVHRPATQRGRAAHGELHQPFR